jgi:hypothetical protein
MIVKEQILFGIGYGGGGYTIGSGFNPSSPPNKSLHLTPNLGFLPTSVGQRSSL